MWVVDSNVAFFRKTNKRILSHRKIDRVGPNNLQIVLFSKSEVMFNSKCQFQFVSLQQVFIYCFCWCVSFDIVLFWFSFFKLHFNFGFFPAINDGNINVLSLNTLSTFYAPPNLHTSPLKMVVEGPSQQSGEFCIFHISSSFSVPFASIIILYVLVHIILSAYILTSSFKAVNNPFSVFLFRSKMEAFMFLRMWQMVYFTVLFLIQVAFSNFMTILS